jgi:hypothetical protein
VQRVRKGAIRSHRGRGGHAESSSEVGLSVLTTTGGSVVELHDLDVPGAMKDGCSPFGCGNSGVRSIARAHENFSQGAFTDGGDLARPVGRGGRMDGRPALISAPGPWQASRGADVVRLG